MKDKRPRSQLSPRNMAMNWLARREHSRAELREKLAAREVDPDVIEATIEQLVHDGLVSDTRFAEAFVSARLRRGQGPVRIRAELKRRGVAGELAAVTLDSADFDWEQRAAEVRVKKFGAAAPDDLKAKARQQRFLEYRGFTGEQIRAAFRAAPADAFGDE